MSTITWQQVALCAVLFAGTIAAHHFLGDMAGIAVGAVTTLVALVMGRKQ